MAKTEQIQTTDNIPLKVETIDIRSQIHIVRGKQVMLDSDLAMLYKVETGALNRAVKRNKKRFPEDFCFQLSEEEFLRCQNGISKDDDPDGRGGRRYMPYAFTEQGISMLSAILRSDVAINVSIGIMIAFVEMRKFLATNSLILNRVEELEVKQLEYQKSTDERFDWTNACIDEELRKDLVEEMVDVLMYYNDVMLCYGITAEELKKSYVDKFEKNMKRW